MAVSEKLMTAEELWAMPEVPGNRFRLVDGALREVAGPGAEHGAIALNVGVVLRVFVRQHRLGVVSGDSTSYIIVRDPDVTRIPDVSFVVAHRIPEGGVPKAFWPIPPDLAVEIVSPGDSALDLRKKVREYLEAGTRLVWVLWPDERAVTAYPADAKPRELGPDDELDGGDVLPGLRVRVADLFDIGL